MVQSIQINMLTTEELLKPRYKVIAEWPDSHLKVGYIEKWVQGLHIAKEFWCGRYDKFPHLFKPLEWYEDRKPEDMPKYVSIDGIVWEIIEWDYKWFNQPMAKREILHDKSFPVEWHFHKQKSLPATESEYLNQSK